MKLARKWVQSVFLHLRVLARAEKLFETRLLFIINTARWSEYTQSKTMFSSIWLLLFQFLSGFCLFEHFNPLLFERFYLSLQSGL